MIKNVFDNKYAECLILRTEGGEAVGLALVSSQIQTNEESDVQYFFNYSTWLGTPGLYVSAACTDINQPIANPQLEDLYIKEGHRGNGQGKRLFGELGAVAVERGCSRMEWRVLKVSPGTITIYTFT